MRKSGQAQFPCVVKECDGRNPEPNRLCRTCKAWWRYHRDQGLREFERYLSSTKKRWGRLFMTGFKQTTLKKRKVA